MLLSLATPNFEYPLTKEEPETEETASFLHHQRPAHPKYHRLQSSQSRPWVISTFLFALISFTLALTLASKEYDPRNWYSYERGFATDLSPAKSAIRLVELKFTGDLQLAENGTWYMDHVFGETQYVGPPGPGIDRAWAELLQGNFIDLKGKEAEAVKGKTFQWPDTGDHFSGGKHLVFDRLIPKNDHKDKIRRGLDRDHYASDHRPEGQTFRQHIDHCLNYVRQEIMCYGDLTPMEWKRGFLGLELKSGQVRTCRDFGHLDSWAKERKGQAVLPHSAEVVSHSG